MFENKEKESILREQQNEVSKNENNSVVQTLHKPKKKIKKFCMFCKKGILEINYKDTELLKRYCQKYNKILTHKVSGNCLKHQHQLANAIKRARVVALLPFVSE